MSDYSDLEYDLERVESLALDSPSKDDFYRLEKKVLEQQIQISNLLNRISAMEENTIILVECLAEVSYGSKLSYKFDDPNEVPSTTVSRLTQILNE